MSVYSDGSGFGGRIYCIPTTGARLILRSTKPALYFLRYAKSVVPTFCVMEISLGYSRAYNPGMENIQQLIDLDAERTLT